MANEVVALTGMLTPDQAARQGRVQARVEAQSKYKTTADAEQRQQLTPNARQDVVWNDARKEYVDRRGMTFAKTFEEKMSKINRERVAQRDRNLFSMAAGTSQSLISAEYRNDNLFPEPGQPAAPKATVNQRYVTKTDQPVEDRSPPLVKEFLKAGLRDNQKTTTAPQEVLHTGQEFDPTKAFAYTGGFGTLFKNWGGGFKTLFG